MYRHHLQLAVFNRQRQLIEGNDCPPNIEFDDVLTDGSAFRVSSMSRLQSPCVPRWSHNLFQLHVYSTIQVCLLHACNSCEDIVSSALSHPSADFE